MKIFICTSKHLYDKVPLIKKQLEENGHMITLPNTYDNPSKEEEMKKKGLKHHIRWKSEMFKESKKKIKNTDAILVLNFEKRSQPNYIGGATFLEIFIASESKKKIFLMNPIPDNIFKDELMSMNPIVINGNLSKIR